MLKTLLAVKKNEMAIILVFIILSLIINLAYNFSSGSFEQFKSSSYHVFMEQALTIYKSGYADLLENYRSSRGLYPFFLAVTIIFFGEWTNVNAVILIQIIATSLATIIIYKLVKNISNQQTAVIAGFLYILSWEIFRWAHFVLSDSLYIFLFILCLYYVSSTFDNNRASLVFSFLFLTLLYFFRPSSFIFAVIVLIFITLYLIKSQNNLLSKTVVTAFAVMLVVAVLSAGLGQIGSSESYIKSISEGEVVSGMPIYNYPAYSNTDEEGLYPSMGYFLTIIAKRIFYFWSIYLEPYSFTHKLYRVLWTAPIFAFALYGLFKSFREKLINQYYNYLLLVTLLSYTIFHAITHVDHDLRLRAPLLIIVLIYASLGLGHFHKNHLSPFFLTLKAGRIQGDK